MPEQNPVNHASREFPMTAEDYGHIKKMAMQLTGIKLSDQKQNMIYGRLSRRIRALRLRSFKQYCDLLRAGDESEEMEFVNAITTNLTSFFREYHHFEYLYSHIFPTLIRTNQSSKKLRIWSAGCSTGEEPYSIAMAVKSVPALSNWDVKILATDLDTNVVAKGNAGVYSQDRIESMPQEYRRFFLRNPSDGLVRVKDSVRSLIRFRALNLLRDWPIKGPFDIIFCRNVVIYFDLPTQKTLFQRYANMLGENRYLLIGHSESLHNVTDRFESLGRTVYIKSK